MYGLSNFEGKHAAMMAEWIMENYRYDTLNIVVDTLKNPPPTDEKVWRINPDTIREWMAIGLDKLAERREQYIQNKKNDDKKFDPDYAAFKARLDEERAKANQQSARERVGRIEQLSYQPPTNEDVADRQLHFEWIKANFDEDGNKKDGWICEEDWRKAYNEILK